MLVGMPSSARPTKISDQALLTAAPAAANLRQLLVALGVAPYGGNYEIIRDRLQRLGVHDARFQRRQRVPIVSPAELARVVELADSYAQAARMLGLGESTAAQRRVKRLAQSSRLDTSHFLGKASNRGLRLGGMRPEPWETLLVAGRRVQTDNLRRRLIAEGLLPPRCSACERDEWQDAPIPLELDHFNGDRCDNRLENLRLLCPNCHAQTETYRGRNIGASAGQGPDATQPSVEPAAARASRRLAVVLGQAAS